MYLYKLKLWNFRKFGSGVDPFQRLDKPDLDLSFNKGLNVLIGENDSGKTAIIDAIKLVLKTHSQDWIKLDPEDFYSSSKKLRIELHFDGLIDEEAKNFIEWLDVSDLNKPKLKVILQATKKDDKILPFDIKAGADDTGYTLNAEAREYLKTTYLRPLRDAANEFVARKNSRLSQILSGHEAFKTKKDKKHYLEELFKDFNENLDAYFDGEEAEKVEDDKYIRSKLSDDFHLKGKKIKESILTHLKAISSHEPKFTPKDSEIRTILESLSLNLLKNNSGLGTYNKLYIATELLHSERRDNSLKLALIEEIEAHIHPQAQLKVIEHLQTQCEKIDHPVQIILTTHSPNLGSKVKLENLIICTNTSEGKPWAFPMGKKYTNLEDASNGTTHYKFLERFLDVTKANLFFTKKVILVEGWSEEILLPVIAENLGYDLTKEEASIVNVGSTAFLRFSKIFQRKIGPQMDTKVAIITDLDVKPDEEGEICDLNECQHDPAGEITKIECKKKRINDNFSLSNNIKPFYSPHWTLEWCLFKSGSLKNLFMESVLEVHSQTNEYQKDANDQFTDATFELKLKTSLGQSKSLDKVKVASRLAEKIEEKTRNSDTLIISNEDTIFYLQQAIEHVTDKPNTQNGNN